MGLLSEYYPEIALRIMKRELSDEGEQVSAMTQTAPQFTPDMPSGCCGMPV